MNRIITINRNLIVFGVTISLLGALVILIKSSILSGNGTLNLAITIDLLITIPFVYFLLIRKTEIPNTTVIPLMIVGLLIGSYFLPQENQVYLILFKTWALPFIEIFVLSYVIFKVRTAVSKYKSFSDGSPDFFITLKLVCHEVFPKKVAVPFATEVAVIYYGFINWKAPKLLENEFTYHKKSGTPSLLVAFILILIIETITLHILLANWSIIVAWILTTLSIYTAIQVFGFAKSLSQRPISINPTSLYLKYGILNEVEIPLTVIENIELSKKELSQDILTRTLSPLSNLESHNVIIHLKKENELIGLYGIKRKFKVIGLHVDRPNDFKEKLNQVMETDF